MKRHLTIFGMFARQNIPWLLVISLVLILVQGYIFAGICAQAPQELHVALTEYDFNHVFLLCFVLLTIRLCITGCDRGGKSTYTYHRLRLSQRDIFLIQAAFNALAYWFYFTVQLLILLTFSAIYSHIHPQHINHMSLLLTAYRVPLFHLVLPLQDFVNWAGTVVTLLSISLCAAVFPLRQRYGKVSITAILMGLLTMFYLYLQVYENSYFDISASVLSMVGSVFLVCCAVGGVWTTEAEGYE